MAEGAPQQWSSIELAARTSYGKLIAALSYRHKDLSAIEDALSDALRKALENWPQSGVPDSPEAWLLTTARRHLLEGARHQQVSQRPDTLYAINAELEARDKAEPESFGDHRLRLMFVCAHPAIDASVRAPLMLQTVLGLDAESIAKQFLVPGKTMGQRLVRTKRKIKQAGIRFETPEAAQLDERLAAVLEGIYAQGERAI